MSLPSSPTRALKAKIVIGNIKCKQDYHPDDIAFHSSDVPGHARAARLHTKSWKKPAILGDKRPTWNDVTAPEAKICVRSASQLIDTALSRAADAFKEPEEREKAWSASTQPLDKETLHRGTSDLEASLRHSRLVASVLSDYKAPHVRVSESNESMRLERAEIARLTALGRWPPSPVIEHQKPFKFSASSSRRFKTFTHSGTYCQTRFEKTRVWSCCLSADPLAQGCIVTTVNPDAYNFASIP